MDFLKEMQEEEKSKNLAYRVIGCAMKVYSTLGPGLLESIYEEALMIELDNNDIYAVSQIPIKAIYDGVELKGYFRIDILVEDTLVLELKSVKQFDPVHYKQMRSYLRLLNKPLGYLINFNVDDFTMGKGWDRVRNNWYDESKEPSARLMTNDETGLENF